MEVAECSRAEGWGSSAGEQQDRRLGLGQEVR